MMVCLLRFVTATIFAHLGIARAQCALAFIYYSGHCVRQNPKKAAHWSSKAASQGNTQAQVFLSNLKLAGFGTPKDYAAALSLVQQAAQRKDPGALHSLAWFYEQGVATEVDTERAFSLWKEAAELNYAVSQHAVADCLFNGIGTARDVRTALHWCELAIKNGFTDTAAKELLEKIRAELGDAQPLDVAAGPRMSGARSARTQLLAPLKAAFTAFQYAVLGLGRQTYHLRQSRTYEQAETMSGPRSTRAVFWRSASILKPGPVSPTHMQCCGGMRMPCASSGRRWLSGTTLRSCSGSHKQN
jgi:TPR repeat protein